MSNTPNDLLIELVPKDTVRDLETYTLQYQDISDTQMEDYMDENGFDMIQVHVFKLTTQKNPHTLNINVTLHDTFRDERPGEIYLNRGDQEEIGNIQYTSHNSYWVKGDKLLDSPFISSYIDGCKKQYNNRSIWYKIKKYFKNINFKNIKITLPKFK